MYDDYPGIYLFVNRLLLTGAPVYEFVRNIKNLRILASSSKYRKMKDFWTDVLLPDPILETEFIEMDLSELDKIPFLRPGHAPFRKGRGWKRNSAIARALKDVRPISHVFLN